MLKDLVNFFHMKVFFSIYHFAATFILNNNMPAVLKQVFKYIKIQVVDVVLMYVFFSPPGHLK